MKSNIKREQAESLRLQRTGLTMNQIGEQMGLSVHQVKRRLTVHKETGLHYETHSNIRSFRKGKPA